MNVLRVALICLRNMDGADDQFELLQDTYRFGVELAKSYETVERGEKQYIMEGVASDEDTDQQGESLIIKGLNFQPLVRSGVINWDHLKSPEAIIGQPLTAEVQGGCKLFVRGRLYVDHVPQAAAAWRLAKAMEELGGERKLGWSVEGAVLARMGRQILKSECRHLALTHQPVNANTFASIVKSMTTANAGALVTENLAGRITKVVWGKCSGANKHHSDNGFFYGGRTGMLEHFTECRGMEVADAASIIRRLIDSGI
jgi:hypothetical protein